MLNKITTYMPLGVSSFKKAALTTIAAVALSIPAFAQKNDTYEKEAQQKEQTEKNEGVPVYGLALGIISALGFIGFVAKQMEKNDKNYERKIREQNGL